MKNTFLAQPFFQSQPYIPRYQPTYQTFYDPTNAASAKYQEQKLSEEDLNKNEFYKSCANQYLRALEEKDFLSCYFLWYKHLYKKNTEQFSETWNKEVRQKLNKDTSQKENSYQTRYYKIIEAINLKTSDLKRAQALISELWNSSQSFSDISLISHIHTNHDDNQFLSFRYEASYRDLCRAIKSNDRDSAYYLLKTYPSLANEYDVAGQSLNHILFQGAVDIEMAEVISENSKPRYGSNFDSYGLHPLIKACEKRRYDLLHHFLYECEYSAALIDVSGRNPLLKMVYEDEWLSEQSRVEICKNLIEKGAYDAVVCSAFLEDLQKFVTSNKTEKDLDQDKSDQDIIDNKAQEIDALRNQIEINRKEIERVEQEKREKEEQLKRTEAHLKDSQEQIKRQQEYKEKAHEITVEAKKRDKNTITELQQENENLKVENQRLEAELAKTKFFLEKKTKQEEEIKRLNDELLNQQLNMEAYTAYLQKEVSLKILSFQEWLGTQKAEYPYQSKSPDQSLAVVSISDLDDANKSEKTDKETILSEDIKPSSAREVDNKKSKKNKKSKTETSSGDFDSIINKFAAESKKEAESESFQLLLRLNKIAKEVGFNKVFKNISEINDKDKTRETLIHKVFHLLKKQESINPEQFLETVSFLIKNKANLEIPFADRDTLLTKSFPASGEMLPRLKDLPTKLVALLLEGGANLMSSGNYGSALNEAVIISDESAVRKILEFAKKKDQARELINLPAIGSKDGSSALHATCSIGLDLDIAKLLVKEGADISLKNKSNKTPFDVITSEDFASEFCPEIMEIFKKYDIIFDPENWINSVDKKRMNAIFKACAADDQKSVQTLIDSGLSINTVNASNSSILHYCAYMKAEKTLQYLLDSGFRVDMKDANGCNPLHHLVNNFSILKGISGDTTEQKLEKFKKMVTALIKAGASLDERDNSGNSALDNFKAIADTEEKEKILKIIEEVKKDPSLFPKGSTIPKKSAKLASSKSAEKSDQTVGKG